jgi:hypothetical protein
MKVPNKLAREFVQKQHPFDGSNMYGQFHTNQTTHPEQPESWYAVYSYGGHWPLFVYANDTWFENEEKNSSSTNRHRSQAHPQCPTVLLSHRNILVVARGGYTDLAKERIFHG